MPNGCVAIVGTRWAQNDLIGRVVQDMVRNPDSDQWEVVEFPAVFEKTEADGTRTTSSLWPEQWSVESLLRTKASMPPFQWSAQYMQLPTSAEAAIIKREWWQPWEADEPPTCDYIIMSLDAAAEKTTRSDFTALTTWGVFTRDGEDGYPVNHIILLNSIKERWEFPTLKRRAYEEYNEWKPDWFVVEKKSAGTQLYQEMRAAGVPVQEFTPHRGSGDKTARLNSVSDIFASGMVWYPAGRRWAEEVVDEVCGFPAMPNDDLCDSTVMALMRFRNGGFIQLPGDRWDDAPYKARRAAYY
jgi:predicted phage terminase large subunit-like protein